MILMSGTFPIAGSLDAMDRGRGEVAEGMTGDDACLGLLVGMQFNTLRNCHENIYEIM